MSPCWVAVPLTLAVLLVGCPRSEPPKVAPLTTDAPALDDGESQAVWIAATPHGAEMGQHSHPPGSL